MKQRTLKRAAIIAGVLFILIASIMVSSLLESKATPQGVQQSIYDFKMMGLDGQIIDFAKYKGKYLLLVNTASKCGYTPQYAELEKLHEQFGNKLAVLGVPAIKNYW